MSSLWMQHSKVVPSSKPRRSANSSNENTIILVESSPLVDRCLRNNFSHPHVYDFDTVDIAIDKRYNDTSTIRINECSEILRSYSTEKPHNFSLEASPVKKENSSLNILDNSFDTGFKFNNTIDKSTTKSNAVFDKLFEHNDHSAILGISRFVSSANKGTGDFATSKSNAIINPHHKIHASADDDNIHASLIRQIEIINNRLASLEQVVYRMENNITYPYPAPISDSSSSTGSNVSQLYAPQDVAFTIDYTYGSFMKEDITCNDDCRPVANLIEHHRQRKGDAFSFRRMFRAWMRRNGRSMKKPTRVEV